MKKLLNRTVVAASCVATAFILLPLGGCKGRTMENMEPTGDTVEVTLVTPDSTVEMPAEVTMQIEKDSVK